MRTFISVLCVFAYVVPFLLAAASGSIIFMFSSIIWAFVLALIIELYAPDWLLDNLRKLLAGKTQNEQNR